ncbi:MAG: hypothetical protein PWR17_858 [Candidatus Methanomethylophilaceae archaeon]|nr:hypothetical protein [Candidatus Methanomethylophilaceae archaeon]NCB65264.1 hypothetical protein [Bacilli bacterium]
MKKLSCHFGADEFEVSFRPSSSPYHGLYPSVMCPESLPYYSTIDDPVIVDIAGQLEGQMRYDDDFYRSSVILAFIQNNIKYVSDESRFGKDLWELPIYTMSNQKADCDGTASLYTSIAHNMGIDVVSVIVTGHMCSAVNVPGCHGKSYNFEKKKYYHVETTADLPAIGRCWASMETHYIARPQVPTEEFKKTLSDSFH